MAQHRHQNRQQQSHNDILNAICFIQAEKREHGQGFHVDAGMLLLIDALNDVTQTIRADE